MLTTCQSCLGNESILGQGAFPADILFISDRPKKSEVQIQYLLSGKVWFFLNEMLIRSNNQQQQFYYTNMIMCHAEITSDLVLKCKSNVINVYKQVKPKVVIFLSKEVEKYYKKEFKNNITILHPEYLIRTGGVKSPYYLLTIGKLKQIKYYL